MKKAEQKVLPHKVFSSRFLSGYAECTIVEILIGITKDGDISPTVIFMSTIALKSMKRPFLLQLI